MKIYDRYALNMQNTMGSRSLWWLLLAIITGVVFYTITTMIYSVIAKMTLLSNTDFNTLASGISAPAMIFMLSSFVFMSLAIALILRIFHKSSIRVLFQPSAQFKSDFRTAFLAVLPVMIAIALLGMYHAGFELKSTVGYWLLLLPLGLLLVLIQTSAEEIVFRGYLQGQLAALKMPKWVWMGVPSFLFGFGHYAPQIMGDTAIWYVVWATFFGLLMADLTVRTGTLAAAIVIHFAVNAGSILLVSFNDYFNGLALFVSQYSIKDTGAMLAELPISALMIVLMYISIRYKLGK